MVLVMAAIAGLAAAAISARRRFVVVTVSGDSMTPKLRSGDRVLVRRVSGAPVSAGTVVVLREPRGACLVPASPGAAGLGAAGLGDQTWVIKRVAAINGDPVPSSVRAAAAGATTVPPGMLVVLGDNPYSADSRTWGLCPVGDVLGCVVRQLPRGQS